MDFLNKSILLRTTNQRKDEGGSSSGIKNTVRASPPTYEPDPLLDDETDMADVIALTSVIPPAEFNAALENLANPPSVASSVHEEAPKSPVKINNQPPVPETPLSVSDPQPSQLLDVPFLAAKPAESRPVRATFLGAPENVGGTFQYVPPAVALATETRRSNQQLDELSRRATEALSANPLLASLAVDNDATDALTREVRETLTTDQAAAALFEQIQEHIQDHEKLKTPSNNARDEVRNRVSRALDNLMGSAQPADDNTNKNGQVKFSDVQEQFKRMAIEEFEKRGGNEVGDLFTTMINSSLSSFYSSHTISPLDSNIMLIIGRMSMNVYKILFAKLRLEPNFADVELLNRISTCMIYETFGDKFRVVLDHSSYKTHDKTMRIMILGLMYVPMLIRIFTSRRRPPPIEYPQLNIPPHQAIPSDGLPQQTSGLPPVNNQDDLMRRRDNGPTSFPSVPATVVTGPYPSSRPTMGGGPMFGYDMHTVKRLKRGQFMPR